MPYRHLTIMFLACSLFFSVSSALAKPDRAETLVKESCQRCHDNSIFTRPNSIIFSYSALKKRVHFCESMAGAGWSEKDINDVIDYLNHNFYHFKR